jgi:ferric-dicitrate binding protein FerR (iron transport regulator)
MNINEELVTRFLKNDCSREEAEYITAYFEAHPEELEKYLGETEYKQFVTQQQLQPAMSLAILQQIKQDAAITPKHYILRYMAAAAVVLLTATGIALWMNNRPGRTQLADAEKAGKDSSRMMVIGNTGKSNKLVTLEDGSVVTLTTGSELKHKQPLDKNERYITLTGRAFFKVAKDKNRPFKVVAGGLITTALGTSFWVDANQTKPDIRVILVTGKVVIQQDSIKGNPDFNPVYLTPGQQLVFTRKSHVARVSLSEVQGKDAVAKTKAEPIQKLAFNQQPLTEVLSILQNHFQVTIAFNKEELTNIKFSGNYTGTDTLEEILNAVALINDLKLERTATGFSIGR